MKYTKSIAAAVMIAGLMAGGAGIAAADDTGDNNEAETTLSQTAGNGEESERNGRGGRNNGGDNERGNCDKLVQSVAEILDMEPEALQAELDGGATIAEVAEANGSSGEAVISALVTEIEEKLAEKVEAGELTQEEADEKLAKKTERLTNKVNGVETSSGDEDSEEAPLDNAS